MQGKLFGTALVTGAMLLGGSDVAGAATDSLLAGTRLVIENRVPDDESRNKLIVSARSDFLAISPPGSDGDPTCAGAGGGGARLTVTSATTGESHTTELPCHLWTGRKTGSWRYADRLLSASTCKMVQIRSTRMLRATCLGKGTSLLDFDLQPGQAQHPIDVTLELGTGPDRYCLRFDGRVRFDGSDGRKFMATDSPAPVACAD